MKNIIIAITLSCCFIAFIDLGYGEPCIFDTYMANLTDCLEKVNNHMHDHCLFNCEHRVIWQCGNRFPNETTNVVYKYIYTCTEKNVNGSCITTRPNSSLCELDVATTDYDDCFSKVNGVLVNHDLNCTYKAEEYCRKKHPTSG